jgi:acetate kinase
MDKMRHIVTVNAGSSSIKFALFEAEGSLRQVLDGAIERIGSPDAALHVKGVSQADAVSRPQAAPNHRAAVNAVLDWIEKRLGSEPPAGIGHRIVHGGPRHSAPALIGNQLLEELHQLTPLDPEHLPAEILLVEAFRHRYPNVPQVACFDTAFHHDLPRVARLLAIPRRYEAKGVRRYGFHGLSYAYLIQELARLGEPAATSGCAILAHLGSGASMAAVRDGRSIDTSMGFTPTAGLVMGSRAGDLDPGLGYYLARTEGTTAEQFQHMVSHESGLLGVSELSADVRELLAREADDVRAAEALALFCYQAKKWLGSFAAALGGLDTLVFSGGIGENSPVIRARICEGLGFLGIDLSETANEDNRAVISTGASRVRVRVIRTDEGLMLARSVWRTVAGTTTNNGD